MTLKGPARLRLLAFLAAIALTAPAGAQPQRERLGRGVVAIHQGAGKVFVSWRLLATDSVEVAFNVYRRAEGGEELRLNKAPIRDVTHFVDPGASLETRTSYVVRAIVNGKEEEKPSGRFTFAPGAPALPYLSIPLQTPSGYNPGDASVGDLDGDGEYEIVLHQTARGRDNSHPGFTEPPILQAYKFDGTLLWQINLGINIREGAHYTQFMVYDLDGDGRAEVACKTADGTRDGKGKIIGDPRADWRRKEGEAAGKILDGPEYLTVFDGVSGAALATENYIPPRGDVSEWGDRHGNRVDRFLACVAYLDGQRPSLVMCRGYYTRAVLAAWNWRDGKLRQVWTFDSDDGTPGNAAYRGQGNHNLSVGDVDGDGRDEIVYGSCVIDDNGKGLYSTGLGHGDRGNPAGIQLRDAATGKQLFGVRSLGREGVVRACALDIDPRHRGLEMWGKGEGITGLFNAKGERISDAAPRTCNMGAWWDGDLLRELLNGVTVTKWDHEKATESRLFSAADYDCAPINGSKSNPNLCADILGDWREEIVARTRDGKELRVFTTTIPTRHRFVTLMHDRVYRLGVVWQNVAYNQPAHPSFFLGEGMQATPPPSPATRAR